MPSGNVRNVNQTDPLDIFFELLDKISATALLMVKVVQHLDVGPVDRAHDLKSVLHRREKDLRIFDQIDRLDHNIDPVLSSHIGGSLQIVDRGGELSLRIDTLKPFAG